MSVSELVQKEPWRTGLGKPRSPLDGTWTPEQDSGWCDGEIEWEGTSNWWWCKKCGYCSSLHFNQHEPISDPVVFFWKSVALFFQRRAEEGVEPTTAMGQLLFVAAVAIRYASTVKASQLREYIQQLIVK